jgi:Swt1-like HEPN
MESPERAAVQRALDGLRPYLAAFVEQTLASEQIGTNAISSRRVYGRSDIYALLKTIKENWDTVFRSRLPSHVRSYVYELLDIRNRWAHQEAFSPEDAERALDTVRQIARSIGAERVAARATGAKSRTQVKDSIVPKRRRTGLNQRDMMRRLFDKWGDQPERLIAEYAAAERRGEVSRKSNKRGVSPEDYAGKLLADNKIKGWLKD